MTALGAAPERVRVWDLPTRLAHWTIVILFGICWWTGETEHIHWHLIAGYAVLGIVLFRLGWGLCGAETARFRSFVRGPAATFQYVRKLFAHRRAALPSPIGHNPLGALSIVAMLGLLVTQAILGLFAVDVDGVASGPFARWVSFETGRRFAHWHAASFHLLLVLIGVHLTAIAFYRFTRGEKLLAAMIHGCKWRATAGDAPYFVPGWRAALLAAGIAICLALLFNIPW
jgi:cytochrome b